MSVSNTHCEQPTAVTSCVTVVKASVMFLLVHFLHLQKKGSQGTHYNSIVQYHSKHLALLLPCNDILTDTY